MDNHELLVRIAEALGIAPKLAALIDESTIVDEAARVRRERDAARVRVGGSIEWLGARYHVTSIQTDEAPWTAEDGAAERIRVEGYR